MEAPQTAAGSSVCPGDGSDEKAGCTICTNRNGLTEKNARIRRAAANVIHRQKDQKAEKTELYTKLCTLST